jgi:hypothetical protein
MGSGDRNSVPIEFLRRRLDRRDDETITSAVCCVAFAESIDMLQEQLAGLL